MQTYCAFIYKGILNRECYIKSRRECFVRPSLCKRLLNDVQLPPPLFYIHAFYYLQQNTIKIVIYTHILPPPVPSALCFWLLPISNCWRCAPPSQYITTQRNWKVWYLFCLFVFKGKKVQFPPRG